MKNYKVVDEKNTYIDDTVTIEEGVLIYPNVHIYGNSIIRKNTTILPGSIIENSNIGENNTIGPYAHIVNSRIGNNDIIGNFVEVKNSEMNNNIKAKHLSYIGNAHIKDNCNIGAGVIFANFNGKEKNDIYIDENVFIGSNSVLVAPLEIKNNSFVAASSTITDSVPEYSLAIARNRQTTKDGYLKDKKC